jgi:DNA-directed RNA polymerase subunit RPC12/RpoP
MAIGRQAECMFLVDCPTCSHRELRSFSALLAVANDERGIVLTFECSHCGSTVDSVTGRAGVTAPITKPVAA